MVYKLTTIKNGKKITYTMLSDINSGDYVLLDENKKFLFKANTGEVVFMYVQMITGNNNINISKFDMDDCYLYGVDHKHSINYNFERDYINTINKIIVEGFKVDDRTGVGTLASTGMYVHTPDILNDFPMIKGKHVAWRLPLVEMLWFLQGRVDGKFLRDHNLNYWKEWMMEDDTIGKSYGYQFRNFSGVDQVKDLIDNIINNPFSRRLIVDIWNPADLSEMALPPCVLYYQLNLFNDHVNKKTMYVNVTSFARSQDMFLGVPYDFMLASWFAILISDYLNNSTQNKDGINYVPQAMDYFGSNVHLYSNHIGDTMVDDFKISPVGQYLNNVHERPEVIDSKASVEINKDDKQFDTFDEYLLYVSNNYRKRFKIKQSLLFNAPKIKAEVAV